MNRPSTADVSRTPLVLEDISRTACLAPLLVCCPAVVILQMLPHQIIGEYVNKSGARFLLTPPHRLVSERGEGLLTSAATLRK